MKSKLYKIAQAVGVSLVLAFTLSCSGGDDLSNGGSNDIGSCNASDYKIQRIGTQTWMAENLNCNVSGSVCYDNKSENCAKYGRLYDWSTAMGIDAKYNSQEWGGSAVKHRGICPSGWHIPSFAELAVLSIYVQSNKSCSSCDAKHLKSASGWNNNGNGTDAFDFAALPAGRGDSDGNFGDVGYYGLWWSASESGSYLAYLWGIYYNDEGSLWYGYYKSNLFSVRCLQD